MTDQIAGTAERGIMAASRAVGVKDTEPLGIMHAAYAQSVSDLRALNAQSVADLRGLIDRLEKRIEDKPSLSHLELRRLFRSELGETRPIVLRDLGWRRVALFGITLVVAVAIGVALTYPIAWNAGSTASLATASDLRASVQDCDRTSYKTQGGVACIIWKVRPPPTSQ